MKTHLDQMGLKQMGLDQMGLGPGVRTQDVFGPDGFGTSRTLRCGFGPDVFGPDGLGNQMG